MQHKCTMTSRITITACAFALTACGDGPAPTMSDMPNMPSESSRPSDGLQLWHDTGGADYSVAGLHQPAPRDARHMPIYQDGRRLFVGVDQGAGMAELLPVRGRHGETELRFGELDDGAGASVVGRYLSATVDDPGLRWRSPPVVRFGGAGTAADYERVVRAVQLVNVILPDHRKMRVADAGPSANPGSGIYFQFHEAAGLGYWGRAFNSNSSDVNQITHSRIDIYRDYTSNGDRQATILIAHELLHALAMFGGDGHVPPEIDSILEGSRDIYSARQASLQPLSLLYPADREAMRALYARHRSC